MKPNWPVILFVVVCVVAYVVLAVAGKEVPAWLQPLFAVAGTVGVGFLNPVHKPASAPEVPASERVTDPDLSRYGDLQ